MRDDSAQWDRQWSTLLTHAHGEEVNADTGFKASLLQGLKEKMAARSSSDTTVSEESVADRQWHTLLSSTYIPCHPDGEFKESLLKKLMARQAEAAGSTGMTITTEKTTTETAVTTDPTSSSDNTTSGHEDEALRTILTNSYKPVTARKEFQTRLLENLKDRQRRTADTRSRARRITFYLSSASGIVAAAMVIFVLWLSPAGSSIQDQRGNLRLSVPAIVADATHADILPASSSGTPFFASLDTTSPDRFHGTVVPASYETVPTEFASYSVRDAFTGPALPSRVSALQNLMVDQGDGWTVADGGSAVPLQTGTRLRASENGMGHIEFPDGSIVTMSPNSLLAATRDGLSVLQGSLLVSVPLTSRTRFRLHFPERDLAIEPGTDLAVMVESAENYAEGGAPAPMVMVVDRPDSPGGLALARGKNGVGPLLAKQLYRLDNYVTADMPSRILCDTECQDLNKLFKMETVRTAYPKASFAGGFAGDRDAGGNTSFVLTPVGFTKRGDRWVADAYDGQETVKIRYLSDSYFGLANSRRDLARELSLGGNVIIDSGDGTFYEIFK